MEAWGREGNGDVGDFDPLHDRCLALTAPLDMSLRLFVCRIQIVAARLGLATGSRRDSELLLGLKLKVEVV